MALFSSSALTLIFSDETRLVRCDLDVRGNRVLNLRIWPRSRDAELPELVEFALSQDSKRPGKVYVLASELWSQKVSVASNTVEGLSVAETSRALAFEAESFSGISAFDSDASFVSLGKQDGLHAFWVTQVSHATRARLENTVLDRGGQLLGILHPAGLPTSLATASVTWNRVENWSGLSLGVTHEHGLLQYRVLNPDRRGQTADTTVWQEALASSATAALPPATITHRLQSNEELGVWLFQWGLALSRGQTATPLIKPEPKPLGKEIYIAAAILLGAISLGIAAYDRFTVLAEITANETEITRLKSETEQFAKLNKDREAIQKQVQTLVAANGQLSAAITETNASLSAQQQRWRQLLHILAEHSSEAMVIQEITLNAGMIEIRGKCLGTDAAHDYATDIASKVRPFGWSLTPAQKSVNASDLYNFVWQLVEVQIPTRPATLPMNVAQRSEESAAPIFTSSDSDALPGATP